jgi:uncharacterized protein (DUF934 family)
MDYQAVLDELLDKINRLGFDSLTAKEKKLLEEAAKNLNIKNEHTTRNNHSDDE